MSTNHIAFSPQAAPATLSPDLEKYRAMLEDIELTEEQARALLLEIWAFMLRCVEAQFTLPTIPDIFAVLLHESSASPLDDVESSKEIRSEVLTCAGSDHGDE